MTHPIEVKEAAIVYVLWGHYGQGTIDAFCSKKSTAIRLVGNTKKFFTEERLYHINGELYAPFKYERVIVPTAEDIAEEMRAEARADALRRQALAITRARGLGLTEEEIRALVSRD